MNEISGFSRQASRMVWRKLDRTGSTRWATMESAESWIDVRKLVKQAKRQTFEDDCTFLSDSERISKWPHGISWELFIRGLVRRLTLVKFRETLESPMTENRCDILLRGTRPISSQRGTRPISISRQRATLFTVYQ